MRTRAFRSCLRPRTRREPTRSLVARRLSGRRHVFGGRVFVLPCGVRKQRETSDAGRSLGVVWGNEPRVSGGEGRVDGGHCVADLARRLRTLGRNRTRGFIGRRYGRGRARPLARPLAHELVRLYERASGYDRRPRHKIQGQQVRGLLPVSRMKKHFATLEADVRKGANNSP